MSVLYNGNMWHSRGVQHFGAGNVASAYPQMLQQNFAQTNRIRNSTAGEGITNELAGLPSGYRAPAAWMLPQKPGALASRNTIYGSGGTISSAQSGYNIEATLTGDGGVSSAPLGLIITLAATLTASGGISSAAANALATLVASLAGSGSVSATAVGLAQLGALLTGSGSVTANNTALMDITATIRGYGDLTPEGIRDTVWQAMLVNYPESGSAGNTLALAGSGGVDYNALATAVWAHLSRTLTSGMAPTVGDITAALEAAVLPVNTVKMNSAEVIGDGSEADSWRGAGVPS